MKMFKLATICLVLSASMFAASASGEQRKLYIAYMGSLPDGEYLPPLHHAEILRQIVDPSFANKSLIRSFKRSFNGFAALLTEQEKEKLTRVDGILSVFLSQKLQLQTTRSWDFMGFPRKTERRPVVESDIIIGVMDGGIWPESESFNDKGFGPVPKKWKGQCAGGENFSCNKKIIGARCYSLGCSARDIRGHGSHVASIAAGNEVMGANYYGLAAGVARGGVPSARLAVYKVCDDYGLCYDPDILTAFDDAIADGVDIISLSIGPTHPVELNSDMTSDPISIGSFHALEKEILTVHAAGNFGPHPFTVTNAAPWLLSVAGSYTDRRIIDKVLLGDGQILEGDSIHAFSSGPREMPLVYGKEASQTCSESEARNCSPWCFESSMIKQKMVLCDTADIRVATIEPGALGYFIPNNGKNVSDVTPSPIAALSANNMDSLKAYKKSTKKPLVRITRSEAIKNPNAPLVAPFSSRGPAITIPDIVKPDVTAPGVEILAAFSEMALPSEYHYDKRSLKYNILSGTSMACPHVTGAAAFVKSFHPDWSASAIKSALMTTAREMNVYKNKEVEFAYGSGHISPVKATDPGLVYETLREDYLKIWCNLSASFGSSQFKNASCPETLTPKELNYPSMAAQVETTSPFVVIFPRTVTNVGRANSRYVATIKGGSKLQISVEPNILQFTSKYQKISFIVTVKGRLKLSRMLKNAALVWTDSTHKVSSPIVLYNVNATSRVDAVSPPTWLSQIYVILLLIVLLYRK